MPGIGLFSLGSSGPMGSLSGPFTGEEIGAFQFSARGDSLGGAILVSLEAPEAADSPLWDRWVRVLRKQGEWPRSWDDAGASVVLQAEYPVAQSVSLVDSNLAPGQVYYYALYALRTDGVWVSDTALGRKWAYPYFRWGFADTLFQAMPRGAQSSDQELGHFQLFLSIFGALLDDMKTDCEHLLTLFNIDEICEDLLPFLDAKIAWPTYSAAGGLQKRRETAAAVDLYRLLGTESGYESMLSEVAGWNCEVIEGWRYCMFTNGRFGCTTPDLTDPALPGLMGTTADRVKYCSSGEPRNWHSVSGLLFALYEIPGVSEGLEQVQVNRLTELIQWGKATFVNYGLMVIPTTEEVVPLSEDGHLGDVVYAAEYSGEPEETILPDTTLSWSLLLTMDPLASTCSMVDRTFHSALEYL